MDRPHMIECPRCRGAGKIYDPLPHQVTNQRPLISNATVYRILVCAGAIFLAREGAPVWNIILTLIAMFLILKPYPDERN